MKYYKTWQEALLDFISKKGSNYDNPYILITEFEDILQQNVKGTYFIMWKE